MSGSERKHRVGRLRRQVDQALRLPENSKPCNARVYSHQAVYERPQQRVVEEARYPESPQDSHRSGAISSFSELAVRVARTHFAALPTPCTVSSLGCKGRGSSSGTKRFAFRGREQSSRRNNNF